MSAMRIKKEPSPVRFAVVEVTPDLAKKWLNNPLPEGKQQRKVHPHHVLKAWAEEMVAGEWKLTRQLIKLGPGECVVDGQNRLRAVIMAGVPVPMEVEFDFPIELMSYLDLSRHRTAADQLEMDGGGPRSNQKMTVVNLLICLDNGVAARDRGYRAAKPVLDRFAELIDWALALWPKNIEPGVPGRGAPVPAALVFMAAHGHSRETLEEFVRQVLIGPTSSSSTAKSLRARLMEGGRDRYSMAAMAVRCMDDYIAGNTRLLVRKQSISSNKFPSLLGKK